MPDSYKQIGDVLSATRKEQKKDLAEIAETTKIMEKYLRAIEEGDPTQLPSPTYFLLFARSYAQNIGLDPEVIDEMSDRDLMGAGTSTNSIEPMEKKDTSDKAVPPAPKFGKTSFLWIIVAVCILVIILIYSLISKSSTPPSNDNSPATTNDSITDQSGTVDFDKSGIEVTPYKAPSPLKLHLLATQDVWAMVVRDGDTILNRELKAGEQRSWEAKYRYILTIGISTAVELTLNGQKVPPLADRARTISNIEINQVNYQDFIDGKKLIKSNPPKSAKATASPPKKNTAPKTAQTTKVAIDTAQNKAKAVSNNDNGVTNGD